jgi:hypothetical protein
MNAHNIRPMSECVEDWSDHFENIFLLMGRPFIIPC